MQRMIFIYKFIYLFINLVIPKLYRVLSLGQICPKHDRDLVRSPWRRWREVVMRNGTRHFVLTNVGLPHAETPDFETTRFSSCI